MHRITKKEELAVLLAEASSGNHMARAKLKEALSTSDMPNLFRQVTEYGLLAQYERIQPTWQQYSSRYTVSDFRPQRFMQWNTSMGQLLAQNGGAERPHVLALPRVPELTEYPTFTLEANEELFAVNKYGARYPFSFEAFLNDEFQVISKLPAEMAQMGRDTEDILTTGVLASAEGPNPDFFNDTWDFGPQVPAGNMMEGNPALSIESLEQATFSISQRYIGTRPVTVQQFALVVPPSLALTAQTIVNNSQYLRVVTQPDGSELRFTETNPAAGRVTVVVNPRLPLIDQSENSATTWYLVPSGGSSGPRQSIITTFMTGREAPELRISGDTGNYIGGGEVPGTEGSFLNDDVQYRVRHITGAVGLDPSPTMASLGNDSIS